GARTLSELSYRAVSQRGVYFFFDRSEPRSNSREGPRVVRVGTHALSAGSRSTLQQRLKQHRGLAKGGGNRRGSICRRLVGQAMLADGSTGPCVSWGVKANAGDAAASLAISRLDLAQIERPIEQAVSQWIGRLPVVCLAIEDDPGPSSRRGFIERNSIA